MAGFPKLGYHAGVPRTRMIVFWGIYWGPNAGKLPNIMEFAGLGFRILGFSVQGLGFRGVGFQAWCLGLGV